MKHPILIVIFVMLYNLAASQVCETIAFSAARTQDTSSVYNLIRTDQYGNIVWTHEVLTNTTPIQYSDDFYIVCGYTTIANGKITANPSDYDYWLIPLTDTLSAYIYPNPASSILNIILSNVNDNVLINIYDMQMRLVTTFNALNYINTITLPALSNAMYFVEARTNNKTINIQKLCVQQN